ncbi:MAG: agmatinase family protein [Chitinophagales bacterium]
MSFNPNDPGSADSNVFGLPYTVDESDLVLIPVPWEATVSYGAGTLHGPNAVLEASKQIDLFHPLLKEVWLRKMAMDQQDESLILKSNAAREKATVIMDQLVNGLQVNELLRSEVNAASQYMIDWVKKQASAQLAKGKAVATVGGDHSTPLGLFHALSENHQFGILQIDAHCDLRKAYEGFTYSHASIMYNALEEIPAIEKLTQVGIRDYCEEEAAYIRDAKGRVQTYFDRDLQLQKFQGRNWAAIVAEIIKTLPEKVFISFDIDGLTPDHCPNTGTPVPGGLQFAEAVYLLEEVAKNRTIIGFDLNEVSPGDDEWDANVGARMLFALCCCYWISRERS